MAFSDNLRAARIAKGLTQEGLALACGWSGQSRIANYESNSPSAREPKVSEVPLLAKALGVPVASLFDEKGESQAERPDFEKLAWTVRVARESLELRGDPADFIDDPEMLEIAYEVVISYGQPVNDSNVIELVKILNRKVREAAGGQEQIVRVSGATGS